MWRVRQAGFLPDAPFADGCGQTLAAAAAAVAAGAVAAGVEGHLGQVGDAAQNREGIDRIGDMRGVDKMLLEPRLDRGRRREHDEGLTAQCITPSSSCP